jgi:hypothetical protein
MMGSAMSGGTTPGGIGGGGAGPGISSGMAAQRAGEMGNPGFEMAMSPDAFMSQAGNSMATPPSQAMSKLMQRLLFMQLLGSMK